MKTHTFACGVLGLMGWFTGCFDSRVQASSDLFDNATPLFLNGNATPPFYLSGSESNTTSTAEAGEPSHRPGMENGPHRSRWWKFTPFNNAYLTLSTVDTTVNTTLAVYTGTRVDRLKRLAANDDHDTVSSSSQVTLFVRAGITYFIAVDSSSAGIVGNFKLSVPAYVRLQSGSYRGQILPDNDLFTTFSREDHGLLTVKTTNTAAISGTFFIGKTRCPFRGLVNPDGTFIASLPRPRLPDGTPTPYSVMRLQVPHGNFSGNWVTGDLEYYDAANARMCHANLALRSAYNVILTNAEPEYRTFAPHADAVGNIRMGASRRTARVAGKLHDGTPFTLSGTVSKYNDFTSDPYLISRQVLPNGGLLDMECYFNSDGTIFGSSSYHRPPKANAVFYPEGIRRFKSSCLGRKYQPPAAGGQMSTHFIPGTYLLSGGEQGLQLEQLTLQPGNRFVVSSANTHQFKFTLNPRTAMLTGSLLKEVPGSRRTSLQAIFLKNNHVDAFQGFIKGTAENGSILIQSPAPP
jgi:hypothetical protein